MEAVRAPRIRARDTKEGEEVKPPKEVWVNVYDGSPGMSFALREDAELDADADGESGITHRYVLAPAPRPPKRKRAKRKAAR